MIHHQLASVPNVSKHRRDHSTTTTQPQKLQAHTLNNRPHFDPRAPLHLHSATTSGNWSLFILKSLIHSKNINKVNMRKISVFRTIHALLNHCHYLIWSFWNQPHISDHIGCICGNASIIGWLCSSVLKFSSLICQELIWTHHLGHHLMLQIQAVGQSFCLSMIARSDLQFEYFSHILQMSSW